MKRIRQTLLTAVLAGLLRTTAVFAAEGGASGAITLLDHGSARASSLAEAVSARGNDVTFFHFNPAALRTLDGGQASTFFRKGLEEQSEGRVHVGRPFDRWAGAVSLGFFDGGTFEAVADGRSRTVTVQRDIVASAGGAASLGRLDVGGAVKYLSSELVGSEKATTVAFDAGFQTNLSARMRVGAAVQNIGPGLKYRNERDPLPQIVRGGMSFALPSSRAPATLSLELPYLVNEGDLQTNLGVEVGFGALALRAGVARRFGDLQWSVGTGIGLGQFTLDYGMAMFDQLSAKHQFSLSMRFAGAPAADLAKSVPASPVVLVDQTTPRRPTLESSKRPVVAVKDSVRPASRPLHQRKVYVVQKGDTLATISRKIYGRTDMWRQIYSANVHVVKNPNTLVEGQKIVLPPTAR